MTVRQADMAVKSLIGEDDFHHIEKALPLYYSLAQTQIATAAIPIERTVLIQCGAPAPLPQNLYRIKKVSHSYTRLSKDTIFIEGTGDATVTYYAYPDPITADTDPSHTFETAPETFEAIPYFAAARAVLADSDMRRYYAFMEMYNNVLSNAVANRVERSVISIVKFEEM